jgi:hypothetical protein
VHLHVVCIRSYDLDLHWQPRGLQSFLVDSRAPNPAPVMGQSTCAKERVRVLGLICQWHIPTGQLATQSYTPVSGQTGTCTQAEGRESK